MKIYIDLTIKYLNLYITLLFITKQITMKIFLRHLEKERKRKESLKMHLKFKNMQ